MPSTSAFKSSCPQTQWTWVRQTLIEANLLCFAIKFHRLPSPVWMVWMASSPSRQASHSPPRPLPTRRSLGRLILKVPSDHSIDESSPSLSCATTPRRHLDKVLLRRPLRWPYHAPHLQVCQSLLRLHMKANPWTIRRSSSQHNHACCVESSSSPGARNNHTKSSPKLEFSPTSDANFRALLLRSQFTENVLNNGDAQAGRTYDWSKDEYEFEESLPSSIGHYGRKTIIDEYALAKFTVPAMLTDFNTYRRMPLANGGDEDLPIGWTKHTHSDGKPYFYHDHDKIITEEWLYDKDIAEKVARYISILKDAISKRSESFSSVKSWHLYVEIKEYELPAWEGDDRFRCRYYFVNHDAECLFWLSKFTLDVYLSELRGKMSPDLIRRYLQREYWTHHYFFSDLHRLRKVQWNTVQKSILLAETDVTMSETSTISCSIDKLKIMSKSIILAEKLDASEVAAAYMMSLLRDQISNYHGQRDARTDRDDSIYGHDHNNEKRTVPFRTMNLLLFHAPIKHYTLLHQVWVDKLILRGPWQRLIEQITDKWQQHVGLATILLTVNMAFLAIPSVDEMGPGQQHRFVTQILCYLSVASSMATIILGLMLVSHHNALKHVDISVVTNFLQRHWQEYIGFERLSIMHSTPYALLMWSMVSFLASFFSMCLESANPVSLKVFVSLAFLLGAALCVWCIYLFWDGSDQWIQQCLELLPGSLSSSVRDALPGSLSSVRDALHSILSYDNISRFRYDLRRAALRTTEPILPTTSGGAV